MQRCTCCKTPIDISPPYDTIKLKVVRREIKDKRLESRLEVSQLKKVGDEYEFKQGFAEGLDYAYAVLNLLEE